MAGSQIALRPTCHSAGVHVRQGAGGRHGGSRTDGRAGTGHPGRADPTSVHRRVGRAAPARPRADRRRRITAFSLSPGLQAPVSRRERPSAGTSAVRNGCPTRHHVVDGGGKEGLAGAANSMIPAPMWRASRYHVFSAGAAGGGRAPGFPRPAPTWRSRAPAPCRRLSFLGSRRRDPQIERPLAVAMVDDAAL